MSSFAIDRARVLGEGSFATVYVGTDKVRKREFAVKIFKRQRCRSFLVEHAALRKMKHVNIVSPVGTIIHKHIQALVLPLCDKCLFDLVVTDGVRECYDYLYDVARGLQHMHRLGYAHRDIKLDNVLVHGGRAMLTDLGMASTRRLCDDESGSPPYCAPEIFVRARYDPIVADMWSLGVVFFACVCGFYPFKRASTDDWRFAAVIGKDSTTAALLAIYKTKMPDRPFLWELVDPLLRVVVMERATVDRVVEHSFWSVRAVSHAT